MRTPVSSCLHPTSRAKSPSCVKTRKYDKRNGQDSQSFPGNHLPASLRCTSNVPSSPVPHRSRQHRLKLDDFVNNSGHKILYGTPTHATHSISEFVVLGYATLASDLLHCRTHSCDPQGHLFLDYFQPSGVPVSPEHTHMFM
jgi:hypothetical protein